MGSGKQLMEYWRRIGAMYHRTDKADEAEVQPDPADDRYYEDLINGRIPSRTGFEKVIQRLTKKDAGVVLVMIGMNHPAAKVVYRYLVKQKREQYGDRGGYLLFRKRKFESMGNPRHALCKKLEKEAKEYMYRPDMRLGKIIYHESTQEVTQALRNLQCQHPQS